MEKSMNAHWTASDKDRDSQRVIVGWTLAWILPFLGVNLALSSDWIKNDALAVVATIGVTGLGVGALLAFHRFLSNADELMRKIQLDALALTVGIGFVSAFSYTLLERAGIIADAEVMTLIVVMAGTYIVGVVAGQRRFA
jgi:hypothetical protein